MHTYRVAGAVARALSPVVAVLLLAATPVAAQSLWLPRDGGYFVRLEGYRPALGDTNLESASTGWFLTGQIPFEDGMSVVVEVPFGYGSLDQVVGNGSGMDLGNPYVGARWDAVEGATFVDFGARLPLGQEGPGALVGSQSDLERLGAFDRDVATLRARAGMGTPLTPRITLEPSIGVATLLSDAIVHWGQYGAVLRGDTDLLFWSAGLTGRLHLGGGDGLDTGTVHHAGGALGRDFGGFRAALTAQLPFGAEEAADWVFGVALQARLQ